MRILFLTTLPSPYRIDFFNELGKDCELTVLFDRSKAVDRNDSWLSNKSVYFKEIFLKSKQLGSKPPLSTEVISYLKEFRNDIIIIGQYSSPTGMLAIEFLKLNKIPFILNADGGLIKNESRLKHKIKMRYISSAKYWLSTGYKTDEYLIHYGATKDNIFHYPFTSINKNEIISKPISLTEKKELRSKLEIPGEKVILGVGSFIPLKNYRKLIESWKKMNKNITLCIVGDGPEADIYKDIIAKHNLDNVILIPFKDKEKLKEYYMCADIFIHPTTTDVWGLVINEALAMGLPVITTDKCVAGVELIENYNNGFITSSNAFDKMLKNIKLLIENEELRTRIQNNNLKKANSYTIENMVEVHLNILKKYKKELDID